MQTFKRTSTAFFLVFLNAISSFAITTAKVVPKSTQNNVYTVEQTELRNNPLFIECVRLGNALMKQINKNNPDINTETMRVKLSEIEKMQLSENETSNRISKLLNLEDPNILKNTFEKIKANYITLKGIYKEKLTNDYLSREAGVVSELLDPSVDDPCKNPKGFALCSAGVAATAQLAYYGCSLTIVTVIGAILCFGAVAIAQTAGIQQCHKDYCR
jgi:hypothetical protein